MARYRTAPTASPNLPPGIPYIVGNEAAERFSYYGMNAVLAVFMTKYLHLMDALPGEPMLAAAANERIHLFKSFTYLTPFLGALVADVFLGKYRTIILLSLVYCLGHAMLAAMGTQGESAWWLYAGLLTVALGAGGIKPCVSAHVGDQFSRSNSHLLTRVFNWFYWSINLGAFASSLLTPWLLEWYGPHWAFGVPGALMALATLVFWLGRDTFIHVPAKGPHFVREFFSGDGLAALGKLLVVFLFVAVFWCLFDQNASVWVLQAENMDTRWLGIDWLPSQIQAVNPLLILLFIPLFTGFIYPALGRRFRLTPLGKIGTGLFLMVGGFALPSIVQGWIDAGQRPSIGWQFLAYVIVTAAEILVSIVSLEYAYTQAPRAMKSFIMSLYLLAVALGNLLAAGVNHFIQVPDTLATIDHRTQADAKGNAPAFVEVGPDGKAGTVDDISVAYENGRRTDVTYGAREAVERVVAVVEARIFASVPPEVPSPAEGEALAAAEKDPWGQPLRYSVDSSLKCRIWSTGPDLQPKTPWDQGIRLEITPFEAPMDSVWSRFVARLRPTHPWVERRKAELGEASASPSAEASQQTTVAPAPSCEIDRSPFVGGLVHLEGATYYWFFTWLMLGSAICFIVVTRKFQTNLYLQDEAGAAEDPTGPGPAPGDVHPPG